MDDTKNQSQNGQVNDDQNNQKNDINQVPAVHSAGNVESAPVNTESTIDKVENYIEDSSEHREPQIDNQVKNVVKVKRELPEIDTEAKNAGVDHSIPTGPNYSFKNAFRDEQDAKEKFEKGDTTSANTFRAIEFIKNIKRGLLESVKTS